MPYIDSDYYLNDYMGKQPVDPLELKQSILRASDEVDRITSYQLLGVNFEEQPLIIINQVKKATAQLTEHYIIHGGYEATKKQELTSVSIGKFNYSSANRAGNVEKIDDIPLHVFDTLAVTGLLYRGIKS